GEGAARQHGAAGARNRRTRAFDRRRDLHLHEPAARDREHRRVNGDLERDVLIAGAGLVGLALAAALARHGLKVALFDRQSPPSLPDPAPWDARVYDISPGSASFLQSIGAWQALSCERIAAIESMRIVGDQGATLAFS